MSNTKQKTAMQELIDEFEDIKKNKCKTLQEVMFFDGVLATIEGKYLQKERQQIVDAHDAGINETRLSSTGNKYYNETYDHDKE